MQILYMSFLSGDEHLHYTLTLFPMVYTHYPHREYFRRLVKPNGTVSGGYAPVGLHSMPLDDLPMLRRSLPATSLVHPGHMLLLSRSQSFNLPHYAVRVRETRRRLHCYPKNGYLLLPPSARRAIVGYRFLVRACETHDDRLWQRLGEFWNDGYALPGPLPALWEVHIAASDAAVGRVIEYINHTTHVRLYAVLESLDAWDEEHALFRARILGAGHHGTCIHLTDIECWVLIKHCRSLLYSSCPFRLSRPLYPSARRHLSLMRSRMALGGASALCSRAGRLPDAANCLCICCASACTYTVAPCEGR